MRRIVLEKKPFRPQLPAYSKIDQQEIRDAAAAWDAAKVAADEAKKTLVQLGQELPNAHLEDARADERLRADGKPKLKGRPATQAAEKGIAEAEHEQRVATLTEQRTFEALQAAIDTHGEAWAESIENDLEALNGQWTEAVNALTKLHTLRAGTIRIAAMVVGEQPGAHAIAFDPAQIRGIEFAAGQGKQPGVVETGDVLAGLAELGMPEPDAEAKPLTNAPRGGRGSDLLRGQAGVEDEIAERERDLAELHSPERVEARRQRAEQRRQEAAQAETLEAS